MFVACKPEKQSGMVLISILMLLIFLMLLIVSQLQHVFLYYKENSQLVERDRIFHQLELETNHFLATKTKNCIIDEQDPNEILLRLISKQACQWKNKEGDIYFYLIEDLGLYPCLQTHLGKTDYSTQHWRITNMLVKETLIFLQERFSEPVALKPCEGTLKTIPIGLISWRYLDA